MPAEEAPQVTGETGPPRSRLHLWAPRLPPGSLALAAAGAAGVFAVNHSDALFHLDLSSGQLLQAGISFLALVGALAFVRRRRTHR